MQKRLFWYPWLCAAMVCGIIVCIALILRMLISYNPAPAAIPSGAQFVKEAAGYALI